MKFVNRFFDSLDYLVDLSISPLIQYFYAVSDFLIDMSDKVTDLPEGIPSLFLVRAFNLTLLMYQRHIQVAEEEASIGINQFLKVSEVNPWVFFERILEDQSTKALVLDSPDVLEAFSKLMEEFIRIATSLQETDFTGVKKAVVVTDIFGIVLASVKNQDVRIRLAETIAADLLDVSRITEFLLSALAQIVAAKQFIDRVQEKMERTVQLAQKAVAQLGSNRPLEVETLFQLVFRVLCEKSNEMASPRRIDFAAELAILMKEIAFARKETFVRAFKHNRKNLDAIVFMFNTASASHLKKDFSRQKDHFLKPVIDMMALLK